MSSRNSFAGVRAFEVEFEFERVCFCGGRKTEEPGEKCLGAGIISEPTTKSTQIWCHLREVETGGGFH